MDTPQSRRLAVRLAEQAAQGDDAPQISEAVCAILRQIEAVLEPVVGRRGVAALFERSLHLVRAAHPWLPASQPAGDGALDPAKLQSALGRQSATAAAAGGGAFLETFHNLLDGLIGTSLTEQLLRAAWANSLNGAAAQDKLP